MTRAKSGQRGWSVGNEVEHKVDASCNRERRYAAPVEL